MDIVKIIDTFFINHDKLVLLERGLQSDLSKADNELSKIYHLIEGVHFSHNTQAHKYVVKLQEILKNRREIKGNLALIRSFIVNTTDAMNKAKCNVDKTMKKQVELLNELKINGKNLVV